MLSRQRLWRRRSHVLGTHAIGLFDDGSEIIACYVIRAIGMKGTETLDPNWDVLS